MEKINARPDCLYDYLNSLRLLRFRIDTLDRRGAYLRERASGNGSFTAFKSGVRDCTLQEKRIMELIENNEMLKEAVEAYQFRMEEAERLLSGLGDVKLRLMLKDRFFLGMSWEDMEKTHYFCTRYLRMMTHKGIKLLEDDYRRLVLEKEGRVLK